MLHKTDRIRGFHIDAVDGEIGHVDDFFFDEQAWTIRYLLVDTSNWIGGRHVLISTAAVDRIDVPSRKLYVRMTRDAVTKSPSVEAADVPVAETLPAVWIL